ncbi:Hypothetical protein NTJ_10978 [Nesidiocoris tenuis]|uniref:PiggyBac transposable element-derived protein 4 C-terminal zinc-ribbon domain-containing protein n=1 Tax=Nesidiocoris tenuis TaxID=355587 RepID=A0ABN7B1P8_9HEMI|nr:Hypothetical protein NTJ_10978 [Nesidiocoris tenuis]
MGSKRGRLLMRQHRIKKESELSPGDGDGGGYEHYRIERQHSEPTPNLLSVPSQHTGYLIKQNSSPHLTTPSPSSSCTSLTPSSPVHTTPEHPTVHLKMRDDSRKLDDFRRTISSGPNFQSTTSTEELPVRQGSIVMNTSQSSCSAISALTDREPCSTEGRSCHCPVLRSGPALGCNYCWNTIDNHGRILRRKTKYHCPECQTNLCIVPCFQAYHERQLSTTGNGSSSSSKPSSSSKEGGPMSDSR